MEITVRFPAQTDPVTVVGASERNLKMIREGLGVHVTARNRQVQVSGEADAVHAARRVLERLGTAAKEKRALSRRDVLDLIADQAAEQATAPRAAGDNGVGGGAGLAEPNGSPHGMGNRLAAYAGGRAISPRTANQRRYLDAIREHDLVLAIGPAGTGKTYLAVAAAVHLLRTDRVRKVVLTRPAVEAGERLGFLPGDLEAKVNPYLRPLLDALHDMMDYHTIRRFMESDVVEIAPLAFMRGRTLNNSVIILDEAQNTTRGQMKMFLTRMGQGSKMIVTGDTTQVDLPDPRESGLVDAARRLAHTSGVATIHLDRADVVRHELVQRVIDAYDQGEGPRDASTPSGDERA